MSSIKKAQEELSEVVIAIEIGDIPNLKEELADSLSCIFFAAYKHGITVYDMTEALLKKTEVCKKRQWVENPDGSYSHGMKDWKD